MVLTGFLGSGKTTLLRDFLMMPEAAETAVIVNEVGEIGLDGAILAETTGGLRMAMLSNGCVCCMLGSDLATTVEQLVDSRRAPLRRIVLETSGLAKPGPILRGLASLAALSLRVSVVATFDCLRGADVAGFEEAAAQWAGAQALALTKRDLATPAQVAAARAMASGLNPLADIIDSDDRRTCIRAAFAPRPPAPSIVPDAAGLPHPRIAVLLVRWPTKPAWDDLAAWLDNLAGLLGERLLRVKGVVAVAESERPLLVQSVGTMFSAPRPFAGPVGASFLVVIARDASPDEFAQLTPVLPITISRLGTTDPFARRATAPLRAV
ncbi:MAG: GTP-binding protein [Acetobacteraceae bacterium]